MKENKTEIISLWVTPEDAKRIKDNQDNYTLQQTVINELFTKEKKWLETELVQMDDEVLKYRSSLLRIREEFGKAYQEHVKKQEDLWNDIHKSVPSFQSKVQSIVRELEPLSAEVSRIDKALEKVSTYRIKEMLEVVKLIESLDSNKLAMFNSLVENFKINKNENI